MGLAQATPGRAPFLSFTMVQSNIGSECVCMCVRLYLTMKYQRAAPHPSLHCVINMQACGGATGTRGGIEERFDCGLISAALANSLSVIMVRDPTDLSGIFCVFGFYPIMHYSGSLLCMLCSATVSAATLHKTVLARWPNGALSFPLIPPSPQTPSNQSTLP